MWFASIWIFTLDLPWQLGAEFFMQHLYDGDAASNTLGWRWVAGVQTRGKHYLASEWNIKKFTNNRFDNIKLNENAPPKISEKTYPIIKQNFSNSQDIDQNNIQLIKRGLRKVVESGTGVSINYGVSNLPPVSGKTGTAEDGEGGLDHAWFVCFTPSEKSELLVVAFAQNTPGGGSVHALPMARQIIKAWNENK